MFSNALSSEEANNQLAYSAQKAARRFFILVMLIPELVILLRPGAVYRESI